MTLVKGKLISIEIAEDGSSVKLRVSDGNAVRLDIEDLTDLTAHLMEAAATAKLNDTEKPRGVPTRYGKLPLVVNVTEINVNHHTDSGGFSISAHGYRGARAVLVLKEEWMRFLVQTYERTRSHDDDGQPIQ
jgi:hypothetical protein